MSPVFGLLALVCHWWKTSGWRLPPPPLILSLPRSTAPWGVSMVAPLLSRCRACVVLLPPPPPSASYLHLLQSFSQHASVLCLVFPAIFLLLPTTIVTFFLFFSSSLLLLIRKSEHTYSRGVYGERWGTDYSSLWSIEDGDEPEESAGWDRSRETHIIHRGLSKPPLPFLLSPLTLCLSLVCSLQEQPPHHFFRAAVPPSSLSLSSPSSFLPVSLSAACTTVGMQRR